ncbi:MAG: right-handed parallel beta-helix repeat-containing protein, partial [Fidelibacterota bacterium]
NGQEGVYFSGTQLTIDDSTVVKNNGEHGIEVYGSLTLKNSYVQDNNAGNTNYYGVRIDRYNGELLIDSTQVTGNANGLYVRNAASGSVVQNSTISDNNQYGVNAGDADVTLHGNTITGNGTGVYATAAAILTRNLISGNSKGVLTSSSPRLSFNNLYGNTGYYLETTGASDIDARTNWWGTTDGSSIAAVIKDKLDDSQLGLVDYSPVLTDTVRWSDTTAPVFTGTAAGYESAAKTKELVSGEWYDHAFPYFEWSPATDAYPVVGYSLLFTEDTSASAVPDELPDVYDTTYTVSQTLANGKTYLLKGRAVDNNFNATGSKTMFVYKYDVGAPLPFDLTYPLDGDTVGIRPLFQWNAAQDSADGAGIEKYLVYIDSVKTDSTDGATTYLLVETPLPEGDHTWFVTAVDSAGHGRVSSQVWTMNVNMSAGGTFVSVALETPGEKSGDVTLEYSLFDESTGSVSLLAEYSTDGGTTWSPASVTGDTSDIPPSGYDGFLVWNSATDLPDREEKNVRVMLTLSTSTGSGWKDTTGVFTVDNYHFHSIDISLAESLPEYTGTVSVTYGLTDTTLDLLTIVPFYTVNDREWRPATILGEVEDLDSSRYDGTLVWDSGTDLAGEDIEGVRLKFVPTDGWKDGDADSTKAFHLDNNGIPSVVVSELEGEQTGDIPVQYVLSDNEGDTLDIRLHYSVDGGPGWRRASLSGDTTGITDYTGSVVWHSGEDLPGQDIEAVQLRLVPADRDVGRPDTTERFHLDNNGLPSVVTSDVTGEQADDVIIPYVLSDPENDTLSILCEYYDGGTAGWNPATVTGVTSGITQSRYSADITWNSRQDLSSADHDVLFRITPADNDSGHPDTVSITLDNNRVPGVQISAVSDTVAVETRIDFTLSDDENDTLTIAGFFSLDDGETWSEASLEGELSGLTAQDYDGSITWLVLHDVGFKRLDKVRFSLAPADRDPGVPDTTGYMTVLNYPADFNGDLRIDTDDLAIFAAAWNADPQDTLYDIGPAGGDVPELTPQPDGLLDFEDLMVFIQMWNWSFAHNGFTPEIATLAQGGSGAGSLALSQRFPEDPWKSDGTVTVDVSLKGKGLLMVDGIFSFDDSNLELTAVSGGGFFKGVFESAPFFHQVSPDSDAVLFASLGLGKREKEVVQFEKVPVASLTFKPSSAGERTLLLNYRLRDFSGAVVETGQVTLDIKDLIPGSFALHPNYPNPFNPVTRIRFEVPEPARVRMTIYDILGREVISLVDKSLKPGYYEVAWDGRDSQGNHASSGMYIYRFRAKAFTATRKMILIR